MSGEDRDPGAAALPNLIVIGAQKCGTSALHYYLDLHPEVQMSTPKELCFFLDEEDFSPEPFISGPEELRLFARTRHWSRGRDWYASHFRAGVPVRGEATPLYTAPWYPGAAARMAAVVPDAKLIFIVREPIDRIVSNYLHTTIDGREWRPLPEALRRPDNIYVARSRYASTLRPFLERFPRSRLLIIRQEDLLRRRRETMREVFRFAGVEEGFWSAKMERERHPSGRKGWRYRIVSRLQASPAATPFYRLPQEVKWALERLAYSQSRRERPALDDHLRARVLDELAPDISALEELTGWDLSEWRLPAVAAAPG